MQSPCFCDPHLSPHPSPHPFPCLLVVQVAAAVAAATAAGAPPLLYVGVKIAVLPFAGADAAAGVVGSLVDVVGAAFGPGPTA